MSGLFWLEIAIAAILVASTLRGLSTGLLRGFFRILGLVLGLWFAPPVAKGLSSLLPDQMPLGDSDIWLWLLFLVSFILVAAGVSILGNLLAKLLAWTPLRWLDRLGGAVLGFLVAVILSSVLLNLLSTIEAVDVVIDAAEGGGGELLRSCRQVAPALFAHFGDVITELGGPPGGV